MIELIVARFLANRPGVTLEVVTESALTDIVRDRFDAGIRPGHRLEQDMIALRIGDDARPVIVASPDYLARHPRPKVPGDLRSHNCFRQRLAGSVVHRWSFEKRGKIIEVTVKGSLISNEADLAIRAALDGIGIARVPAIYVESHVANKRLVSLLEDRTPRSVGFFLYYSSRRQMPVVLQAFINVLKSRMRESQNSRAAINSL